MVDKDVVSVAELGRENAELKTRAELYSLGRENAKLKKRAELWEHRYHERYHTGADFVDRLQAVARAANRVSFSDGFDLTIWGCAYSANGTDMCGTKRNPGLVCGFCELKAKTEGLERDDLEEVE